MKRWRVRRENDAGFSGRRTEESVIELANDARPPDGAEAVADTEELHDWRTVTPPAEG